MTNLLPVRKIVKRQELTMEMCDRMYQLMDTYYANMKREDFDRDMSSKSSVILLLHPENLNIIGFSTLREFEIEVENSKLLILYSGDTIIEKDFWGSNELAMAFGEYMISLIRNNPNQEIYWFLMSKGFRTYKFLPAFFKEYYPKLETKTPDKILNIMEVVAEKLYPNQYNKATGIINAQHGQYLKEDFQPVLNQKNKTEVFYFEKNPGFVRGDELVCLTRLSFDNICDFIKRALKITE